MDPLAPYMLGFIALGCLEALIFDLIGNRTKFAKEHSRITSFAGFAIVAVTVAAAIILTHQLTACFLPLFGFFIKSKVDEGRAERKRIGDRVTQLQGAIDIALAGRDGAAAVEIDVSKASQEVLQALINNAKKKGLTVETVTNQTSRAVSLRLSGSATAAQ